jgi:hypothetical protein
MLIPIEVAGDTLLLGADDSQYIVGKKQENRWLSGARYFSTLGGAFNYLLELAIRNSDCKTLEELKDTINKHQDWLLEQFVGLKPRAFR